MKILGRIVSRGSGILGVFFPIKKGLPLGIYEIREILGELQIIFVGKPVMEEKRFTALDLNGLANERSHSAMTIKEFNEIKETESK